MEGLTLSEWKTSVSSLSVNYAPTDHSSNQKCSVRVMFEVAKNSMKYQEVPALTFPGLGVLVGAWMGYITIAETFLMIWQKYTRPFGRGVHDPLFQPPDELNEEIEETEKEEIVPSTDAKI